MLGPTITLHASYGLLALVWAASLALRRRLPGPSRLDGPLAALILVYVLAVADSAYPRVSFEASLLVGAVIVTFYAFHDLPFLSAGAAVRGFAAFAAAAAIFALRSVGQEYASWARLVDQVEGSFRLSDALPPNVPRVADAAVLVNTLAMALNLTWPFALLLALEARSLRERAPAVIATLLAALALFFTLSRGGWLGAAAGAGVFGGLYLLRSRDIGLARAAALRSRRLMLGVGAAGAVILVAAAVVLVLRWDSRPEWLFRQSLSPRYDAVSTGWEIFRERPLFGSGPYTYSLLYNAYSGKYPIENIHPHNGYLAVLVDTGIAGGAVLLFGLGVLASAWLRAFSRADPALRLRLAACAASLTTLAVHSLADSPNAWNTALLPLAAVLALTLRLCTSTSGQTPAPSLAVRLPALGLLPLLLIAWALLDMHQSGYQKSLRSLDEGRFSQSAAQAVRAADREPSNAAYQLNAGVQQALFYSVQIQAGAQPSTALLRGARDYLQRAIEHEPRSAIAFANLALVESALTQERGGGDWRRATDAAESAIELGPRDGTIAGLAGWVFEKAGLQEQAASAYALAVSSDSSLLQSPYWGASPSRLRLRDQAVAASGLTPCEAGRISALYGGYTDRLELLAAACSALLQDSPNDALARAGLAVIYEALGRDAEARREARAALARVPDDAAVNTAVAIADCPGGDVDLVRRELLRAAYLGDADAALLLTYTYRPPPAGNPVPGNIRLPSRPEALPKAVLERLRDLAPTSAPLVIESNGRQRYLLGILYYRVRFLRESPSTILIPGEWTQLASPRALLIEDALQRK